MTSRVVTSWIAVFGTSVDSRAAEMTFEIATNDSVDSFPPRALSVRGSLNNLGWSSYPLE